ncbi:MAG TPA: T9SS type A sorting domain-containing protein [Bacteroidia bacterium]|nr:T9SS type A sorting domain-containing protein [Bacteroidia bacterium]
MIFSSITNAQNWNPLNGSIGFHCRALYADSSSNYLYASGNFQIVDGLQIKCIAKWDGNDWDSVGNGLTDFASNLVTFKSDLYACGAFSVINKIEIKTIARWDGFTWDSLSIQPDILSSDFVASVTADDSFLYVAGGFRSIGGISANSIATWDGAQWRSLNFPDLFPGSVSNTSTIVSACKFMNKLYVGGVFRSSPVDTIGHILCYDGVNWTKLENGIRGNLSGIADMCVYKGELYVAGLFTKASGNYGNNIQKWNGYQWSDVNGGTFGMGGGNGQIHRLIVFHDQLYACGVFTTAGGIVADKIAKYDGEKWCSLGSFFDNGIGNLAIYKDSLYVGGGFNTIDGDSIKYIASWNGGTYVDTCNGLDWVENEELQRSISIFPLPAETNIFVISTSLKITQITIYNSVGEKLKIKIVNSGNSMINLQDLVSGVYLFVIETDFGIISRRFLKL